MAFIQGDSCVVTITVVDDILRHCDKKKFRINLGPSLNPYGAIKLKLKAVCGSYSIDALRYIVLLPE